MILVGLTKAVVRMPVAKPISEEVDSLIRHAISNDK